MPAAWRLTIHYLGKVFNITNLMQTSTGPSNTHQSRKHLFVLSELRSQRGEHSPVNGNLLKLLKIQYSHVRRNRFAVAPFPVHCSKLLLGGSPRKFLVPHLHIFFLYLLINIIHFSSKYKVLINDSIFSICIAKPYVYFIL